MFIDLTLLCTIPQDSAFTIDVIGVNDIINQVNSPIKLQDCNSADNKDKPASEKASMLLFSLNRTLLLKYLYRLKSYSRSLTLTYITIIIQFVNVIK